MDGTSKQSLRRYLRDRVSAMLPPDHQRQSLAICHHLHRWLSDHASWVTHGLGGFSATATEPRIMPVLTHLVCRVPVYLPTYNQHQYAWGEWQGEALTPGRFNILEPIGGAIQHTPPNICLIPALGIDGRGHRLGWGYGYYDRLLHRDTLVRMAVIYDCQRLPCDIPINDWDIPMTHYITEKGVRPV